MLTTDLPAPRGGLNLHKILLRSRSLDTGDQSLKALMTQLAQVVNSHFGEPDLDKNKLELVKDATKSRSVAGEKRSLP